MAEKSRELAEAAFRAAARDAVEAANELAEAKKMARYGAGVERLRSKLGPGDLEPPATEAQPVEPPKKPLLPEEGAAVEEIFEAAQHAARLTPIGPFHGNALARRHGYDFGCYFTACGAADRAAMEGRAA